MDIEFHYYMTYLIAARAGFSPTDAATIATAAQEVDDNHVPIKVSEGTPQAYDATVSQTMDILRPHHDERIYPIFHFIPGEPDAPTAQRRDGRRSPWVTTPNSPLANAMLDTALRSGSLHRIGASAHAYADTWAHQNFIGREDGLNELARGGGLWDEIKDDVLKIGHALAGHQPDIPDLIWTDGRLANNRVVNAERFLDAAKHLYLKFCEFTRKPPRDPDIASLQADLRADIGEPSATSRPQAERIARYQARALTPDYGSTAIPPYSEGKWSDAAFIEDRADVKTRFDAWLAEHGGLVGDMLRFGTSMTCTWRDPARCRDTDWYKFQEAVKAHLDECAGVLARHLPDLADAT